MTSKELTFEKMNDRGRNFLDMYLEIGIDIVQIGKMD